MSRKLEITGVNVFDFYMAAIDDEGDDAYIRMADLPLEQLREIHRKLGQVISYFDDP